jgi:hypothetical protein
MTGDTQPKRGRPRKNAPKQPEQAIDDNVAPALEPESEAESAPSPEPEPEQAIDDNVAPALEPESEAESAPSPEPEPEQPALSASYKEFLVQPPLPPRVLVFKGFEKYWIMREDLQKYINKGFEVVEK